MTNLPQSSQDQSLDSLAVTRGNFKSEISSLLAYLAQALGGVSGSYSTQGVDPTAVTLQGTPSLASAAEPSATDNSLRFANTRWIRRYGLTVSDTAPTSPVDRHPWVDTTVSPPVLRIWSSTPSPGAWVTSGSSIATQIPQVAVTAAYTLAGTDVGKHIYSSSGGVTVPASIFSIGDVVSIVNNSTSNLTLTQGSGVTMYLSGTATTGNRTLAQRGIATVLCVSSNTFIASGAGVS